MEFETWYRSLPFFTKHFLLGSFILAGLATFEIVPIYQQVFSFPYIFKKFQIWRILTSLLFLSKFKFDLLFQMLFAFFGISKCEAMFAPQNYAEFFYLCLFNAILTLVVATIFNMPLLSGIFIFSLLYIWCKRCPFEEVTLMFGMKFKSGNLPWVLLLLNLIFGIGQSFLSGLCGIGIGHLYIVLKDILPVSNYRYNFLKTPIFFDKLVRKYFYGNQRMYNVGNVNVGQQQQQQQNQGGFQAFQGQGHRLN